MTLQQRTYLIFFGLCILIGLPLVMLTGQPIFFGVGAMVIATLWWALNEFRGVNNG